MPIKSYLLRMDSQLPGWTRALVLHIVLFLILLEKLSRGSLAEAFFLIGLGVAYSALFWSRERPGTSIGRFAAILGLWVGTVLFWMFFDAGMTAFALIFFLVGYSVTRLPWTGSLPLIGGMIAVDSLLFFMEGKGLSLIGVYALEHAGVYVLLWGARIRREADEESKRHYAELQVLHGQLAKAHEELQQTHRELEEASLHSLRYAVLEERTRIARDLHDSIGHGLTSVIVQLQALPYMLRSGTDEADSTLSTVLDVARGCLQEVRSVVHHMALDETGLGALALKSLIQQLHVQSGLPIHWTDESRSGAWTQEHSELLYRVLQEALTNIIRHADASRVDVKLEEADSELVLTVRDNGTYRGEPPLAEGFGLAGMRARCERAGGVLTVAAVEPQGLELKVRIPIEARTEERGERNDGEADPGAARR
ncbi:sensor histidine kinase [Paenibacillus filicis]